MAITDNMLAAIHMNGDWDDEIGTNGTAFEATFDSVNQKLGSDCGDFDGTDDYVDFGDIVTTADAITVSMWIKVDGLGAVNNNAQVVSKWTGSNTAWTLGFKNDNTNAPWFAIDVGSTKIAYAGSAISDTNWHHVLGLYDGSNVYVYLDNSAGTPVVASGNLDASTADMRFGDYAGGGSGQYGGLLDEVLIWDRAITSGERTTVYNGGAGEEYPFAPSGWDLKGGLSLMGVGL